ncbi:TetR/AcrR family transcriptional regulator C-terminal domain-containing protein [Micromonospora vinacea]
MRVLAQRGGLPAHALYRHVRNRADLLAAMAEQITAIRPPGAAPLPSDPRQRLERLAGDEWAMYRRHPWLLAILATDRPPTGPAVLAMVDRVVAAFTSAGYDPGRGVPRLPGAQRLHPGDGPAHPAGPRGHHLPRLVVGDPHPAGANRPYPGPTVAGRGRADQTRHRPGHLVPVRPARAARRPVARPRSVG